MDDYPSEMDDFADDEEGLDSDGEPLPSPEEIIMIINSIPSFKFEEAPPSDVMSEASSARKSSKKENKNGSMASAAQSTDSFTARQKKEIKR